MRNLKRIILMAAAVAVFAAMPAVFAQSPVAALVAKMPGQNAAEADAASAEFVTLGAAGIKELCGIVKAPGTEDDTNARFAMGNVVKYVSRGNMEADRAMIAGAIIESLQAAQDKEIQSFLISQLEFIAKDECVTPLSAYLADDRLCDPASRVLAAIGTLEADAALCKALPESKGNNRLSIIQALASLESAAALAETAKDALSTDARLRQAALNALAQIADSSSADVLTQAIATAPSASEKAKAVAFYLAYAARTAEKGDAEKAETLCRDLMKTNKESNIQSAALSMLVALKGPAAVDDLLAAADSDDIEVRAAGLKFAAAVPGPDATQKWLAKMAQANPVTRAEIIAMLGRRGDKAALPPVVEAVKAPEKAVRFAAMDAAARLGEMESFAPLIDALQAAQDDDEIAAVKDVLLRIPAGGVTAVAKDLVPKLTPPARKAFIEILAARRAQGEMDTVYAQAQDGDESVRLAAIDAMPNLCNDSDLPRIIELVLKAQTDSEKAAAQKAIVAVAKLNMDAAKRADPVLSVLDKASAEQKVLLLPALPGIGEAGALAATVALTKAAEAPVKDAAIRALADWQEPAAIPELLSIAKTAEDLTQQVLALRGYVRLAEAAEVAPDAKLQMFKDAVAACKRPEDKGMVLAAVAGVHTLEALQYAGSFLEDNDLKTGAALAAVKIAVPKDEKEKGIEGAEAAAIVKKAAPLIADEELRKKAEAFAAAQAPAQDAAVKEVK